MNGIDELYYYTNVETMRYILENANIYATNLRYMNDSEEYTNGLTELRNIINDCFGNEGEIITPQMLCKSMKSEVNSYSISFSTTRDLLSQWSMYSKESGISLKMNFSGERSYEAYPLKPEKSNERKLVTNLHKVPQEVFYCTKNAMSEKIYKEVKEQIKKMIEKVTDETSLNDIEGNVDWIWKQATPYVKRYEFNAEGEYRLVFNIADLLHEFRIDYRNDKNVLKPYLDVKCTGGWPICEIIVGPGFNQEVVYNSIKHFIDNRYLIVPKLNSQEFKDRCKSFLCYDNKMPEKVENAWLDFVDKVNFDETEVTYNRFIKLLQTILKMEDINDDYRKRIDNRFFSKYGIVLSKSEIPYIF